MLWSSPDYKTGQWSRWELKTSTSSTCPQKVWQRHHLVKYLSNPHLKRYMLNGLLWRQCTIQILYWIEPEVCRTRKFSVCCFCIWNLENDKLKDLINPKQVLLQSPLFPYKVMHFFLFFSSDFHVWFFLFFFCHSFFLVSLVFSFSIWFCWVFSLHWFNMYINLQPLLRADEVSGNVMPPS